VKDKLPSDNKKVLKYSSEINADQENLAVTISDANLLKYCDESVWWMPLPELPIKLKLY
jgi:hypothetical protein